eukprot:IDg7959t1
MSGPFTTLGTNNKSKLTSCGLHSICAFAAVHRPYLHPRSSTTSASSISSS